VMPNSGSPQEELLSRSRRYRSLYKNTEGRAGPKPAF
jgi:hypothetical protein